MQFIRHTQIYYDEESAVLEALRKKVQTIRDEPAREAAGGLDEQTRALQLKVRELEQSNAELRGLAERAKEAPTEATLQDLHEQLQLERTKVASLSDKEKDSLPLSEHIEYLSRCNDQLENERAQAAALRKELEEMQGRLSETQRMLNEATESNKELVAEKNSLSLFINNSEANQRTELDHQFAQLQGELERRQNRIDELESRHLAETIAADEFTAMQNHQSAFSS
ncbi:hypothetical protein DIPPA_21706 [Diplonema papillatum]|nr:hypothetical protein DIPPA_21706 [Diplonema papillatum]